MRVNQTQVGSSGQTGAPTDTKGSPSTSKQRDDGGKESRFGSALDKKVSAKEAAVQKQDGDPLEEALDEVPSAFTQMPPAPAMQVTSASSGAAVSGPPEIRAIEFEIVHALEVAGPNEVRIHFEAQALDGLSITLNREGGVLQVSMQVNSPEMARFLEAHAATLAQRLDMPDRPAFISIETRSADPRDSRGNSQGGNQQERDAERDEASSQSNDAGAVGR